MLYLPTLMQSDYDWAATFIVGACVLGELVVGSKH